MDVPLPEVEIPVIEFIITREFRAALQSLDNINLVEVFSRRPSGMRTVPTFMRGGFRNWPFRKHCQSTREGVKRMLLFEHPRKGVVAKEKLMEPLEMVRTGRWEQLMADNRRFAEELASCSPGEVGWVAPRWH